MKVDMHVHTCYSKDATLSLETIMESCEQRGLDGVAITDHNTIAGALALKEIAPFLVIVGEEIDTTKGEILGLFLKEEIPGGLMPEEAMARIREQGGLVGVSHPLDRLRRSAMRQVALLDILDELDFLEGFNSRVTFPSDNRKAQALAQAQGLPITAGSGRPHRLRDRPGLCGDVEFQRPRRFSRGVERGPDIRSAIPTLDPPGQHLDQIA